MMGPSDKSMRLAAEKILDGTGVEFNAFLYVGEDRYSEEVKAARIERAKEWLKTHAK